MSDSYSKALEKERLMNLGNTPAEDREEERALASKMLILLGKTNKMVAIEP